MPKEFILEPPEGFSPPPVFGDDDGGFPGGQQEGLTEQQRNAVELMRRIEVAREAQERVYQALRYLKEMPLKVEEAGNPTLLIELGKVLTKQELNDPQTLNNLKKEFAEKTGITLERAEELLKRCSSIQYFLKHLVLSPRVVPNPSAPDFSFLIEEGVLGIQSLLQDAQRPQDESEMLVKVLVACLSIGRYYKISEMIERQAQKIKFIDAILDHRDNPDLLFKFLGQAEEQFGEEFYSIASEAVRDAIVFLGDQNYRVPFGFIQYVYLVKAKLQASMNALREILKRHSRTGLDPGILIIDRKVARRVFVKKIMPQGEYVDPDWFKGDLGKLGFIILESPFEPYTLRHEYAHFERFLLKGLGSLEEALERDLLSELEAYLLLPLPEISPSFHLGEPTLFERLQKKFERPLYWFKKEKSNPWEDYWRQIKEILLKKYLPNMLSRRAPFPKKFTQIRYYSLGLGKAIDTVKRLFENGFSLPAIQAILLEAKEFKDVYQYNRLSNKDLQEMAGIRNSQFKNEPKIEI